MRIALLTTDSREHFRSYSEKSPYFGAAPEALLQGFATIPEIEVHVVSCTRGKMTSPEKLAPNIWFHSLYVSRIGWTPTLFQGCIRAVRRKLKNIRPDIVHGQGTERDCALNAVFSGFPNVVTIHGNMAELARFFKAPTFSFVGLAARLENATLKRTSGVFCNSAYTEEVVGPRAVKTWRVPNPIRQPFFDTPSTNASPDKCILLNVGLVSERKRQLELIEVARRLHEQGRKFEIQFVGHANRQNPYAAKFLERMKEAERGGYARYVGVKSTAELIALFDTAHGLVHFPSEEAFGLVVAEAMARNLAFFGAGLGGIIDISEGVPGAKLFAPEDWDGLTSSLSAWIESGYHRASGAAEIMNNRYHPRIIAQRHWEIYREVLGKATD